MTPILSLLLILGLSVLVTRIATVILAHTGLSREMARFQARSAFSGAGFTTNESEKIVNHPLRRRVASTLILMGNAGVVTAIASVVLTFAGEDLLPTPWWLQALVFLGGVLVIWFIATSQLFDRLVSRLVRRALQGSGRVNVVDIDSLLHLADDYRIGEIAVRDHDSWLADKTLGECRLRDEGVTILAIQRADGTFIGSPVPQTHIEVEDTLVCYGTAEDLESVEHRIRGHAGDRSHDDRVGQQEERERDQQRAEARRRVGRAREDAGHP